MLDISTLSGQADRSYLREYEANNAIKPIDVIVMTDGVPTDDVETPIIYAAERLDLLDAPSSQVGVQFVQVGQDKEAREALKRLDDGLRTIGKNGRLRDIVDTVMYRDADGRSLSGESCSRCGAQALRPEVRGFVSLS